MNHSPTTATPCPGDGARQTAFEFGPSIPVQDIQDTFELARMATASLYGLERLALEPPVCFDAQRRTLAIDTFSDVGRCCAVVFFGFSRREFGDKAVKVIVPHVRRVS
jgi:hypothetical protein